ncbi:MAG TPA: FAD-dependent oxidoreductase [Bryobacteraceae bacterium]|nr:FAD-dependent oxidoreductase [Bryobacteraceae bacterium]
MRRRDLLGLIPATVLHARELNCDVMIAGGGMGGCAAAIAACRNGMRVIMTEETRWIGGQLTSQAVPPDEHPWIEQFGGTALYRSYRRDVREHYRRYFPITAELRAGEQFNPGGGTVSRLTHEPRVSLAVLEAMLLPWIGAGQLTVLTEHELLSADIDGARVRSVTVRSRRTGDSHSVTATTFLDATEQGDLLPLTKTEFVTGFESRQQTGEPHAPEQAQPDNIQSFTVCFPMAYDKARTDPIDKPKQYEFWRDYVPKLRPAWPGKLLSWTMSHPVTLETRKLGMNPVRPYNTTDGSLNLWLYRRIAAQENFVPGAYRADISLVNWPQNDYWLGNLHNVSKEEAARHLEGGRQLSLSLLYWMQTAGGFPGLHLRPDQTGTEDGLAMYPYIRESRRIRAEFTVVEQHVSTEARMKLTGKSKEQVTAEDFPDSVGVGSYRIDLHPSSGGDNYIDISSLPFQIPLGALIPVRVENVIPACKNLGVTHITNGCYRLHPVEWNIGESAGCLAAAAVNGKTSARAIRNDKKRLADFQRHIQNQGIEIAWPQLTPR